MRREDLRCHWCHLEEQKREAQAQPPLPQVSAAPPAHPPLPPPYPPPPTAGAAAAAAAEGQDNAGGVGSASASAFPSPPGFEVERTTVSELEQKILDALTLLFRLQQDMERICQRLEALETSINRSGMDQDNQKTKGA